MMRAACPVVMLSLLCAAPSAATPPHEERKAAGYGAFEVGRYTEAIGHFEAAYRLRRDPRLLYNLGLAYYRRYELSPAISDLRQARNLLRRFLALVPPPAPTAADAAKVRAARRFAQRYLRQIDATLAAAATQGAVQPPPRTGETRDARLQLSAARAAKPPPPRKRPGSAHWWLYGLAGLAGGVAALTGGLALEADGTSDTLAARGDREANAAATRARGLAAGTDVLLGVAVVSAVVGLVLHYRARRAR